MRPDRAGFTLLEVLAALLLTVIVVGGSRTLLDGLRDSSERTAQLAATADAFGGAEGLLRELFDAADATGDGSRRFAGTPERIRFTTWCDAAGGWLEQCRVELAIDAIDRSRISLLIEDRSPVLLRRDGAVSSFAFLQRTPSEARWSSEWQESFVPPTAIGFVTGADTAVFLVGADR